MYPSLLTIYSTPLTNTKSTGDSIVWKAHFRWHWCQDDGTFEPYNDKMNSKLEQFYEKWKLEHEPSIVITSPLIRYCDDIPQSYLIDLQKNIQKNTKTKFSRRIERRALKRSLVSSIRKWYFRNEHNEWSLNDLLVQQIIENAYESYLSGQGPSRCVVHFPGRSEPYEIDFLKGRQMNTITNEI